MRGVDIKPPEYGASLADEFRLLDLRRPEAALIATGGTDEVYALAADMGGMGYISANHSKILRDNFLINVLNMLDAATENRVARYLYTSSGAHPEYLQETVDVTPLKEADAYPAQPQDAYGWEKLISERLCAYYQGDHGIDVRVVRFHNIFGPLGTWDGDAKRRRPRYVGRSLRRS